METYRCGLTKATDQLVFPSLLMVLALVVPRTVSDADSKDFILLIGVAGIWHYSMGGAYFLRGMLFPHVVYPRHRRRVRQLGSATDPSHVLLMVTSLRIDTLIIATAYRPMIREAVGSSYPTTMVCSIVGMPDEILVRSLQGKMNLPGRASLGPMRIPGTGRRDGLACDFHAIPRYLPDDNAAVAVIGGDTVLGHGMVEEIVLWFRLFPSVGDPTTNKFCEMQGGCVMSEWHELRFAQRHTSMYSMILSKRVPAMTRRMSVFCVWAMTNSEFVTDVENGHLEHWRLSRLKSLADDGKPSWFSLMCLGYDTFYVPDATINTVEHPPEKNFIKVSHELIHRWYNSNLRQNSYILKLDARRLGWFAMLVLFDQHVSVWISLPGLVVTTLVSLKYSIAFLSAYLLWIGPTRLVLILFLSLSGHRISPAYPLVLYYSQIVGALVKIYVLSRFDRQSWTR